MEQSNQVSGILNMAHIHKSFKRSDRHATKKTKNLKQIITLERAKEYKANTPTCKALASSMQLDWMGG